MKPAAERSTATIAATATAVPPHILMAEDVKTYMRRVFDVGERRLDAMMAVIDHAQVRKRHAVFPVDYIITSRSLEQISRELEQTAGRRVIPVAPTGSSG